MLYSLATVPVDTNKLTNEWIKIKKNLDFKSIKPMRFLRYFIASIDDDLVGSPPSEKLAFQWLNSKENASRFNIETHPIDFAEDLAIASGHYRNFLLKNQNVQRMNSRALDSFNLLAGPSTRQHMGILLTAARFNCPASGFEKIVECLESAFFYCFSVKVRSQVLQSHIAQWTTYLKKIGDLSDENIRKFAKNVKDDLEDEIKRFYQEFDSFGQEVVSQKYRQKYILAKFVEHSERTYKAKGYDYLSDLVNDPSLEIEHIFPQSPSQDALTELGFDDQETVAQTTQLLANLLLIEGPIHKAVSNQAYSTKKKEQYKQSKFWLVKKFAGFEAIGPHSLKEDLKPWPTHEKWSLSEIKRRQDAYSQLAKRIWDFGLGETNLPT